MEDNQIIDLYFQRSEQAIEQTDAKYGSYCFRIAYQMMEAPKIFESEYRFCLLLWEHEPVNSTKLVALCKDQLGWSKATTYTVIRRLAQRGVIQNENTIVSSLISKEEAQRSRLEEMVDETFEGSMPAFIAAFSKSKKLTKNEVNQLQALIDSFQED